MKTNTNDAIVYRIRCKLTGLYKAGNTFNTKGIPYAELKNARAALKRRTLRFTLQIVECEIRDKKVVT